MEEIGIYRVSGVATDIQALKTAFDTSEYKPDESDRRSVGSIIHKTCGLMCEISLQGSNPKNPV